MNNSLFNSDKKIIDLNCTDLFSCETFTEIQKFSYIDEKSRSARNVKLINLDAISRNGSMYAKNSVLSSLSTPYVSELFHRGTCFGELEHPSGNCSRERFLTVDPNNICHRNINYHVADGSWLRGDVQFVAPKGPIAWDWITNGCNMGFSIRILTPNFKEQTDPSGNTYVYKYGQMQFISFDCVRITGFKDASIADPNQYDASAPSTEDWKGIHESVRWTAKRTKDEFMNLLSSQEALPRIEDIYGFNLKDVKHISYSEEGLITLDIEKNQTHTKSIKIPTNVYRLNQVLTASK